MVAARSAVVISPRSSTSLPTTTAVMMSGYCLVSRTAVAICARFFSRLLPSQMPWMTFSPDLGRDPRHLVEAVLDRIGAHAVGDLGELREILLDLVGRDVVSGDQRRLRRRGTARRRRIAPWQSGSIGARASLIGVASHHHTAAIAPRETSRSASGVRREIGSVLREGSVDYLLARPSAKGSDAERAIALARRIGAAAVRPRPDKIVTLLDKIRNYRSWDFAGLLRRIGDPFGRHHLASARLGAADGKKLGNSCGDGCSSFEMRSCGSSPPPCRPLPCLLVGLGGASAQSGDARPGPGQGRRAARRRRQGRPEPAPHRRVRRSRPGHQRPGRQPRMRLARPPRGAADVAWTTSTPHSAISISMTALAAPAAISRRPSAA